MTITAGILEAKKIEFSLNGKFFCKEKTENLQGKLCAKFFDGKILFDGKEFPELNFENQNNATFTLFDVKIGKNFHWQQFENQTFEGNLKIISDNENLVAINVIDIEKYLYSVISSEMSSTSFAELLKAHAVISRSWLLANIAAPQLRSATEFYTENSLKKWYERDSHTLFDVCADDHCQRYQGLPKQETPTLKAAVEATKDEVLTCENEICDTRFSKCCGGKTEIFSTCWADKNFACLPAKIDFNENFEIDLTDEQNAQKFIFSSPQCFCNTQNKSVINQVFNDYDQTTQNFFRWKIKYSNAELSAILREKSGIDFGKILDLIPLKRGTSGRIYELKIVGEKRIFTVGKELEIRRWLSKSHLYSSAFVAEKDKKGDFTLTGTGWGHGVGLCQIGAAVMSAQGFDYQQILAHYFPNSKLVKHI
ncbi:MAG: SpoIID/LytB domain-containing protein [Prevotellaceae bacterium]|jgi:SpoIID/LytB domain protein|nr:SpoIID/LytB domain-containing protein [Prevotellaceae bacterium]